MQVQVLFPAPNSKNPNLIPIGEGFGFVVYFDYPNFNSKQDKQKRKTEVKKMNLNIGNIGVWGFRHYEFLKQNRPSTVGVMRMNGTLEGYLKEVNQEATEMLETLVRQYAKAEEVTEALKRADQLEWVRRMNNIRNRAEEVVLNELIYR